MILLGVDCKRDFLVALSLANMCYFRVWAKLFNFLPERTYHLKYPPSDLNHIAALLNVLLLSALLFGCFSLARVYRRAGFNYLAWAAFFFCFLISVNNLRMYSPALSITNLIRLVTYPSLASLLLFPALMFALALVRRPRLALSASLFLVLLSSPFVLVTFSQSAWTLASPAKGEKFLHRGPAAKTASTRAPSPRQRIVWILFDAFDYRLGFHERPRGLEMPELDRFRAQAFSASHAHPPTNATITAVPSLLSGVAVATATPTNPDELMLDFQNKEIPSQAWSKKENIFQLAHKAGLNVGVIGWYHPYCRLFGEFLASCDWYGPEPEFATNAPFLGKAVRQLTEVQTSIPGLKRLRPILRDFFQVRSFLPTSQLSLQRQFRIGITQRITSRAVQLLEDPNLDFVFIHISVPHDPDIFDAKAKQFSTLGGHSYIDNLALADQIFGSLRQTMETGGSWDRSAVIVTSDHGFRPWQWWRDPLVAREPLDMRVPFLVKMPKHRTQKTVQYDLPFESTWLFWLVQRIQDGTLRKESDIAAWMKSVTTKFGPSPPSHITKKELPAPKLHSLADRS